MICIIFRFNIIGTCKKRMKIFYKKIYCRFCSIVIKLKFQFIILLRQFTVTQALTATQAGFELINYILTA